MSTPLLTPLESAIFDEDVIADLEAHFDDDLACTVDDCGKAASVTVAMRCCSTRTWVVCDEHLEVGRRQAERALASMLFRGRRPKCVGCGHRFARGAVFEDVYRVVEL